MRLKLDVTKFSDEKEMELNLKAIRKGGRTTSWGWGINGVLKGEKRSVVLLGLACASPIIT